MSVSALLRSDPTLAISDSVGGTPIMPSPTAPTTLGSTRFGKYGMPRLNVEPYRIAPSIRMPPAITATRGGNRDTSRDDAPTPMTIAMTNGTTAMPGRSVL